MTSQGSRMRPDAVRRNAPAGSAGILRLLLGLSAAGLAACSESSSIGPGHVVSVRIVPDTLSMLVGVIDTAQAFPLDESGAFLPAKKITWATTDPLIAMVDNQGSVTAIGLGTAQLSASSEGISDTAVVNVTAAPVIAATPGIVPLSAIAKSGATPGSSVAVTNSSGGPLSGVSVGTISYGAGGSGWLSATLDQSSTPATLTVTATPGNLPIGTYSAQVPLLASQATNSPANITVNLSLTSGPATTMAILTGDLQAAMVGSSVTTDPAVLVTDQFGNPVSGVAVAFAVATGGGTVTGGAATTGANGIAAATDWQLGTVVGSNTLTATSTGLTGSPLTFTATATVGAALQIAVSSGNSQSATVGQAVVIDRKSVV